MAARWYAAVCGAAHDAVLNAWQVSRAGTWAGTAQHGDIRATDMVALALSAFDQARQLAPRMPKIAFLRADLFMALNRYEVGGGRRGQGSKRGPCCPVWPPLTWRCV